MLLHYTHTTRTMRVQLKMISYFLESTDDWMLRRCTQLGMREMRSIMVNIVVFLLFRAYSLFCLQLISIRWYLLWHFLYNNNLMRPKYEILNHLPQTTDIKTTTFKPLWKLTIGIFGYCLIVKTHIPSSVSVYVVWAMWAMLVDKQWLCTFAHWPRWL